MTVSVKFLDLGLDEVERRRVVGGGVGQMGNSVEATVAEWVTVIAVALKLGGKRIAGQAGRAGKELHGCQSGNFKYRTLSTYAITDRGANIVGLKNDVTWITWNSS